MNVVSLAEAVCLASDVNPDEVRCHDFLLSPFVTVIPGEKSDSDLRKLYDIALSSIGVEGGLTKEKRYSRAIPSEIPCVKLRDFGTWILKKGVKIPGEFPLSRISRTVKKDGHVTLEFPYKCDFIEKISEIMFNHYSQKSSKNPSNQTAVALEIDEAIGWKNQIKNEKASRAAIAIAAKIQPMDSQKLR